MVAWSICNIKQNISSVAQLCPTLCDPMDCSQASLSITNSWSLLKLMSIQSVMPSSHLILCHPLLLLLSIFPSIRVFSSESVLRIRWPKYWRFIFSISPFPKQYILLWNSHVWKWKWKLLSHVWLFATPWTIKLRSWHQVPSHHGK